MYLRSTIAACSFLAIINSAYSQSTIRPSLGTPYVRYDLYNGSGSPCNGSFNRSLYTTNNENATITLGSCEQFVLVSTTTNSGNL